VPKVASTDWFFVKLSFRIIKKKLFILHPVRVITLYCIYIDSWQQCWGKLCDALAIEISDKEKIVLCNFDDTFFAQLAGSALKFINLKNHKICMATLGGIDANV
jgi:hypothetical protein